MYTRCSVTRIVPILCVLVACDACVAQKAKDGLPANWRGLRPLAFANPAETVSDNLTAGADTLAELGEHAAAMLMECCETEKDYGLMLRLQRIGQSEFHNDAELMESLRKTICQRWLPTHWWPIKVPYIVAFCRNQS